MHRCSAACFGLSLPAPALAQIFLSVLHLSTLAGNATTPPSGREAACACEAAREEGAASGPVQCSMPRAAARAATDALRPRWCCPQLTGHTKWRRCGHDHYPRAPLHSEHSAPELLQPRSVARNSREEKKRWKRLASAYPLRAY